jgi:hypothetical protein
MPLGTDMSLSRTGAWIIIASKHLMQFALTEPGLSALDAISFSGKCGNLIIKLSADETEQLNHQKVIAHARLCGISAQEVKIYLNALKA